LDFERGKELFLGPPPPPPRQRLRCQPPFPGEAGTVSCHCHLLGTRSSQLSTGCGTQPILGAPHRAGTATPANGGMEHSLWRKKTLSPAQPAQEARRAAPHSRLEALCSSSLGTTSFDEFSPQIRSIHFCVYKNTCSHRICPKRLSPVGGKESLITCKMQDHNYFFF
jgi:hypothetical protein